MSHGAASRLAGDDFRAILGFLADAHDVDPDTPYPSQLIGHLDELVAGAHAIYRENDLRARRSPVMVDGEGRHEDEDDALYWAVGPCPITQYRSATGDLSAARVSDVIALRRYRDSPVYRDYFAPNGVGPMLDLGLPARPGWQRTLLFCRATSERDFSERDRDVLEMLRPHLRAREARAELRRRLLDEAGVDAGVSDVDDRLTIREREVAFLAARGRTNAQIAAELWITPSTVKKHLEHVYEKLDVSSRAAAAGVLQVGLQLDLTPMDLNAKLGVD